MMVDAQPHVPRLLAVDDDEGVCFTICAIAEQAGFETHSTTDPGRFFDLLESWKPSHIVLDLKMPDVDGVEILRDLAGRGGTETVIITSGLGQRVLEAAARAAAENGLSVGGILPKPFTPSDLQVFLAATAARNGTGRAAGPRTAAQDGAPPLEITEGLLAEALDARAFDVHFQPKVDCGDRRLIGFEGLVRWPHPELGMIMPDRFIPLAESTGLIAPLTSQVCERALGWFAQGFLDTDVKLAVNISARILADADFPGEIVRLCAHAGVPPAQVILEITETSALQNPVAMLEILTQFRIKGFRLSIDDFGVGYSSMVQLARLPFSELKIDKTFVMTAQTSEESQKIASAVVGLAQALGLDTIAEGVEDEWTLDFLAGIGCGAAQGYYIARPMDGAAALDWHRSRLDGPAGEG